MKPPNYFQRIRDQAKKRWDQLDADPDLAAPWHQLFRQVQSPRHVLSELLQNADDAKRLATEPFGPAEPIEGVPELAAWTVVGNVLLNLDETVMKR